MANRKLDPKLYRTVSVALDRLARQHGEDAITAMNKYLRLRREELITTKTIERLEDDLENLKKVRQISSGKVRRT